MSCLLLSEYELLSAAFQASLCAACLLPVHTTFKCCTSHLCQLNTLPCGNSQAGCGICCMVTDAQHHQWHLSICYVEIAAVYGNLFSRCGCLWGKRRTVSPTTLSYCQAQSAAVRNSLTVCILCCMVLATQHPFRQQVSARCKQNLHWTSK